MKRTCLRINTNTDEISKHGVPSDLKPKNYLRMKNGLIVVFVLMCGLIGITSNAYSSGGDTASFNIRGYVRAMPSVMISREFTHADYINMVHNRLNTRWSLPLGLSLVAEGRNRLLYNELLEDFPTMADLMDYDDGLVDLTRVWLSQGGWLGTLQIDRSLS